MPFCCLFPEPVNSSQYHLIKEPKTWLNALSYCRESFTDLVSIRDEEQNEKVRKTKGTFPNNTWIGLKRDSWEWSDDAQTIPESDLIFHSPCGPTVSNGTAAICYKGIQ